MLSGVKSLVLSGFSKHEVIKGFLTNPSGDRRRQKKGLITNQRGEGGRQHDERREMMGKKAKCSIKTTNIRCRKYVAKSPVVEGCEEERWWLEKESEEEGKEEGRGMMRGCKRKQRRLEKKVNEGRRIKGKGRYKTDRKRERWSREEGGGGKRCQYVCQK